MDIRLYELQKKEQIKDSFVNNAEETAQKDVLQKEKKEIRLSQELLRKKEDQMNVFEVEIEKMDLENSQLHEEIKKREQALYEKQTNFKELESMKEKIDELTELYKKNEEEHLAILEEFEKMKQAVIQEKNEIEQRKKNFNKSLAEYQKINQYNLEMSDKTEKEIMEISAKIDPELLDKYYQISKKYPLQAVALLDHDQKCTHCRLEVSVVKLREIEQDNGTICESCSRWIVGKNENIK